MRWSSHEEKGVQRSELMNSSFNRRTTEVVKLILFSLNRSGWTTSRYFLDLVPDNSMINISLRSVLLQSCHPFLDTSPALDNYPTTELLLDLLQGVPPGTQQQPHEVVLGILLLNKKVKNYKYINSNTNGNGRNTDNNNHNDNENDNNNHNDNDNDNNNHNDNGNNKSNNE